MTLVCFRLFNYFCGINFIVEIPIEIVAIVVSFVLCSKPINIFIKNIFITFAINIPKGDNQILNNKEEKSLPNAGKLIGIMERFLVLTLIFIDQYSAVGLIIAAKSILRYKSPQQNEYTLVGTLLSFGIAVMIGILIQVTLLSV